MKKIILFFCALGIFMFPVGIYGNPVWAGEADVLIDILLKKRILTPEEAKDAMSDVRKEKAKEKADVEEVAKETATEVAKAEIESKSFELPKGLKGVSIGGTYFLEYYDLDSDDDTKDFSSFRVQRAYFTVKKKFTPWFSSRLTTDITYDSKRGAVATDASEIGWEVRLKYAYGKFDLKNLGGSPVNLKSEVGLVHTFSDDYDAALWPYRCQGQHFLDRHSIKSSADYGVNVQFELGSMDKDFKKRISKKYAAKWGGVWLGVHNGSGYNKGENNDNKTYEAGLYVRPLNMIEFMQGLRIGAHYMDGESNELLSGSTTKYGNWEITQFMVSYQHEYFTVMGQLYDGKGEDGATDEVDRKGYNLAGFVRMPFHKPLRIFARYDLYDDDDSAADSDKDEKTTIYGISYDLTKGVMPWAAIEDKDFEDPADGDDHKMFQLGMQIKF